MKIMGSNKPGNGKDMLLAIDIGNTNFTVGVFRERELLATFTNNHEATAYIG